MRAVPILMVHSNVSVKLAFQGMGIYAQVFMERFQKENLFSGCTKTVMNSFNVFIILDIDECSDKSTHSCDSNSNCTNTNGSYQCKCHQGFAGNGHTCTGIQLTLSYACYYFTDIDECSEGSHMHVIKMRPVPILMVHSNVNVKLAFQEMGIHVQICIQRFLMTRPNVFSICIKTNSRINSLHRVIIL